MFTNVLSKKLILWGMGLALVLGIGSYFILGRKVDLDYKQQLIKSQKAVSRIQVGNIETFFEVFGNSLVGLSENLIFSDSKESITRDLDKFVDQWRRGGLIAGATVIDKEGVVIFNSNILGTRDTGASLADRDYFEWSKNAPKDSGYFIGEPIIGKIGASKGELIVPVVTPIFRKDKFNGAIIASVKLDFLTQYFLGLTEVGDSTIVYLVDGKGVLLYKNSEIDIDAITQEDYFIVKTPVRLGNLNWNLVMATPQSESVSFSPSMFVRVTVMLLLISITLFAYGLFAAKENDKFQVTSQTLK